MNEIITIRDVTYTYPNSLEPVLKNVSLAVREGEFAVIMGRTGAGKTTLAMTLNGIIPQLMEGEMAGDITVAGMDLSKYQIQTITQEVGLVLQDPETQIVGRTVEEDVAFGPRNYLMERDEIYRCIDASLARVRLAGYNKRATSELSGGEKQRLSIAGVLAMNPSVLVLDEPTSELDPLGREEIYTTIRDLKQEKGLPIVAVEHSSQEICEKADRLIILDEGEVVWSGIPRCFFTDLPLVHRCGIKPLPISEIGWALEQKGFIAKEEIPINIDEAYTLIRRLLDGRRLTTTPKEPAQVPGPSLIRVENLSFCYDSGKKALDQISLNIHEGDYIAIIGQNGSGKTTLAKHFNSLLKPTDGSVTVCGLDTANQEPESLARYIGYVFQNPDHQIFCSTVYKELEFGLKNAGLSSSEIEQRIDEVAHLTGLEAVLQEHPYSLGKGERQKIAVASILAMHPKILVVDEPTTGQDWSGIQVMMELMDNLHRNGTTIVMITHDMDVVAHYAKRAVVMCHGNIVMDGPADEVLNEKEILASAFVTPPQVVELSQLLVSEGLERSITSEEELARILIESLEEAR
ncbi:ABC transporter ATP-binding protein [Sinanaerobacter chloroacetimidivorans]|uniref:ATP-binding cassette domain-containing protein n=1 Tax=Sinanaerobacter chloroacetimidivorans TaxID=2818044 RepID=A0A8J7W3H1_9FIRM|nr:energy-coupling factor transporter ATPase [Sinanaerobacter chloroacetimidivorans]MBR0598235.1 ATP-binding cassette domain-containing protein [Sinanaerobacter chloroacetimidivorans]